MVTTKKDALFCTKCGRENTTNSTYCVGCGSKLVYLKKINDEKSEKIREKEKRLNQVTLKNMSSKISNATFIDAKFIIKPLGLISTKPKLPTIHDSKVAKVIVILSGTLESASDVTDGVKRKILKDIGTDLDVNHVKWITSSLISSSLNNKGWHAIFANGQWYMWPMNGSTINSLITIDYVSGNPSKNIIKDKTHPGANTSNGRASEGIGAIIGCIAMIIFFIWFLLKLI